jgi:hypothetical protein
MASDLSKLDLLIIQIDSLHIGNDPVLVPRSALTGMACAWVHGK